MPGDWHHKFQSFLLIVRAKVPELSHIVRFLSSGCKLVPPPSWHPWGYELTPIWPENHHLWFYLNLALSWKTPFLNFLYAEEQNRKAFLKSRNLKNIFFVQTGPKQDLNWQLRKISQLFLFIPVYPSTKIYTKYSICSAVQPWFQWWGCNLSWEQPGSRRGWFPGHHSLPEHLSPSPVIPLYHRKIPHSIISGQILINNF